MGSQCCSGETKEKDPDIEAAKSANTKKEVDDKMSTTKSILKNSSPIKNATTNIHRNTKSCGGGNSDEMLRPKISSSNSPINAGKQQRSSSSRNLIGRSKSIPVCKSSRSLLKMERSKVKIFVDEARIMRTINEKESMRKELANIGRISPKTATPTTKLSKPSSIGKSKQNLATSSNRSIDKSLKSKHSRSSSLPNQISSREASRRQSRLPSTVKQINIGANCGNTLNQNTETLSTNLSSLRNEKINLAKNQKANHRQSDNRCANTNPVDDHKSSALSVDSCPINVLIVSDLVPQSSVTSVNSVFDQE